MCERERKGSGTARVRYAPPANASATQTGFQTGITGDASYRQKRFFFFICNTPCFLSQTEWSLESICILFEIVCILLILLPIAEIMRITHKYLLSSAGSHNAIMVVDFIVP